LIAGPVGISASSTDELTATYSITFESFSWTVDAGETEKMLMKCDVSNVALDTTDAASDTYKFYIETTNSVPTMVSEDEDGDSITEAYDVDGDGDGTDDADDDTDYNSAPTACPTLTVAGVGTLTLANAADAPTSTIILGNSTGVTVQKLKLTSTKEAFTVKKVKLFNNGSSDAGANAVKVAYTNSDGATETKTGYLSGNYVTFDNMDMAVAKDSSAYLTVTVDTAVVDSTTIDGTTIDINLDANASTEFEAIGVGSGATIGGTGATNALTISSYEGNAMTLYKTKPTISLASGSPSGAGIPGLNEIFRFNVAADSRGYVTVHEFTFKVNSQDLTSSGWNDCDAADWGVASEWGLYDSADLATELGEDADWLFYDSSGGNCTANEALTWVKIDLQKADGGSLVDNSDEIAAGSTITYILKADTTGASAANDDSIRIDLDSEANTTTGVATADTIEWADDAYANDIDGTLVKTLPTTGGTIIY
jgi:hypothetical protein